MRTSISQALQAGRILVSDGAWGTQLYKMGLQPGDCPEAWNLSHPDDVLSIAAGYMAAGADLIETNSFGGSRLKLARFGLAEQTAAINHAAAAISRQAAGDEHWVIASIGPSGKLLITEEVTEDELYTAFCEQAVALAAGGADALCIETMSDPDEAAIAARAARENTPCEVICTFTFSRTVRGEYRTMMGTSPVDAASAALAAGATIIGANCGNGFDQMIPISRELRAAFPDVPILVQANAGMPQNVGGAETYPETPAMTAAFVPELIAAGVQIIGGCCGTTPEHIRAIRQAVDAYRKR